MSNVLYMFIDITLDRLDNMVYKLSEDVSYIKHKNAVRSRQALGEHRGWRAQEHFFSLYLRDKFSARTHHRNRNNSGPKLLADCLPGEQQEVGVLLFALATHEQDYRLVLLGAVSLGYEISAAWSALLNRSS